MNRSWLRLPLEGAHNVRELGGLPAAGGEQTGWHRFLRADQLQHLSASDRNKLYTYGVRTVIDLRSGDEVRKHPDSPEFLAVVDYHHVPFIKDDLSPEGQNRGSGRIPDLAHLYLVLLEQKEVIKLLFELIGNAREGCILFHCMAGKDRTGILSLLLLMLAGADKQDCLTNYMQSYVNLSRDEEFMKLSESGFHRLVRSDPETMAAAYDAVAACEHGIRGFLTACGIPGANQDQVRMRCLGR